MKRSLLGALTVALVGGLSGCGAEPGQESVAETGESVLFGTSAVVSPTLSTSLTLGFVARPPKGPGEPIGREDPSRRGQFNTYDAQLAALAMATIKCKGSVDPDDYDGREGVLKPRFDKCPNDEKVFEHIKNLLGIQEVSKGDEKTPSAAQYFSSTWERARAQFPRKEIPVCPDWQHEQAINPPTKENVERIIKEGGIGKESALFTLKSPICNGPECAVKHAQLCSMGFGSQWWIKGDYAKGAAYTDPVWWLDDTELPPASNPFLTPGYYHAMSYYGYAPGAVYGAVNRKGEYCSKYYAGYHYKLRLQPVYCAPDWICMTECR